MSNPQTHAPTPQTPARDPRREQAERLREMAEVEKEHAQRNAKWFMEEEAAGKYASANVYATVAARQGLNVQALLAGAEAIEAVEVARGHLKRIIHNRQGEMGKCCGPVDQCECSECHAQAALARLEDL